MMSKQMERAHVVALAYDKAMLASDARFNFCVRIFHEEGTIYFFENAFMMEWKDPEEEYDPMNAAERQGEWLLVFTEHQGCHVFSFDDLFSYAQYSKFPHPPEVLK